MNASHDIFSCYGEQHTMKIRKVKPNSQCNISGYVVTHKNCLVMRPINQLDKAPWIGFS